MCLTVSLLHNFCRYRNRTTEDTEICKQTCCFTFNETSDCKTAPFSPKCFVCLFCHDDEILMQLSVTHCLLLQMYRDSTDVMFNWHLYCFPLFSLSRWKTFGGHTLSWGLRLSGRTWQRLSWLTDRGTVNKMTWTKPCCVWRKPVSQWDACPFSSNQSEVGISTGLLGLQTHLFFLVASWLWIYSGICWGKHQ